MIFILLKCRISIVKDRYDAIREELSAAENRKHVVEKEITENYRLSPDMQKGFDPIGQKNNDFRLAVVRSANMPRGKQAVRQLFSFPVNDYNPTKEGHRARKK